MDKTRVSRFRTPVLVVFLVCLILAVIVTVSFTQGRNGLVKKNGTICYYNEDGTLFTGGYLEVMSGGKTDFYFFQEDGTAFTGGYKAFDKDGKRVYYYFQEDGSAFTDGYLEVVIDGTVHYFYFQENGQGFTDGYKSVDINGEQHYFFFGSDGRAITNTMKNLSLGDRTVYMLFGKNGKACTEGLMEFVSQEHTDYYYFLANGQAFTTGYKTVELDGSVCHYYFENDGKAFTGGLKEVSLGEEACYYYFGNDGKAKTADWETIDGIRYYFQPDGRAAKNTFVTIDGDRYYFGEDYAAVTDGWFCVDEGYHYADSNGKLATNTVVEGYVLDENGRSSTKYRIVQLVQEHTDNSMTDQEKIDALYNWILKNDMIYISNHDHVKADWEWKDSWVDDFTVDQLDNGGGNCFCFAALSGFLFREATGLPVTVYHGWTPGPSSLIPHGWTSVCQDGVWYVYDAELYKFRNYSFSFCYKEPAEDSVIHVNGDGTNLY